MKRIAIALVAGTLLSGAAGLAKPTYVGPTKNHYKLTGKPAAAISGCLACHNKDRKSLNAYGKDMAAAMKTLKAKTVTPAVLNKVNALDSDKDGVKNGLEIKAGTNPGDATSK